MLQVNDLSTKLRSEEASKSHLQGAFNKMRIDSERLQSDLQAKEIEHGDKVKRLQNANAVSLCVTACLHARTVVNCPMYIYMYETLLALWTIM